MVVHYTSAPRPSVDSVDRSRVLTVQPNQRHRCEPMELETKFLRLPPPVEVGEQIDGWQVCWRGGLDKARSLFLVHVFCHGGGGSGQYFPLRLPPWTLPLTLGPLSPPP